MFKLKADPTFLRTVDIRALDGTVQQIQLEMRHMRKAAFEAFMAGLPGREDIDIVCDIVAGWRAVGVDFSREAVSELLQEYESAALSIYRDYVKAYEEARAKN